MGKRIEHRLKNVPHWKAVYLHFPHLIFCLFSFMVFHIVVELSSFSQGEGPGMYSFSQEKVCFREGGMVGGNR